MRISLSAVSFISFLILTLSAAAACECECVGGPDGRDSLGRASFPDSLSPAQKKNSCEELCNGYIPPGSATVARTSTCVFPRPQVQTFDVEWCSASPFPAGVPAHPPPAGIKL